MSKNKRMGVHKQLKGGKRYVAASTSSVECQSASGLKVPRVVL